MIAKNYNITYFSLFSIDYYNFFRLIASSPVALKVLIKFLVFSN
jgi:hypothetical protein